MQSSVSEGGIPQKAVDGSTSTFYDPSTSSLTEVLYIPASLLVLLKFVEKIPVLTSKALI